jgi:hypothetical protein
VRNPGSEAAPCGPSPQRVEIAGCVSLHPRTDTRGRCPAHRPRRLPRRGSLESARDCYRNPHLAGLPHAWPSTPSYWSCGTRSRHHVSRRRTDWANGCWWPGWPGLCARPIRRHGTAFRRGGGCRPGARARDQAVGERVIQQAATCSPRRSSPSFRFCCGIGTRSSLTVRCGLRRRRCVRRTDSGAGPAGQRLPDAAGGFGSSGAVGPRFDTDTASGGRSPLRTDQRLVVGRCRTWR